MKMKTAMSASLVAIFLAMAPSGVMASAGHDAVTAGESGGGSGGGGGGGWKSAFLGYFYSLFGYN